MKNTLTEENYLKAIFHLADANHEVTVNEMSKFLNVKMPTVNSMMKKFAEKKWVIQKTYKPLKITEKGMKEAALVVRKHRLTEMFLVEIMNFGWENVHEIAEQIEHLHSPLFFEKMDEMLNYPKFDPHGEPIPDKEGNIISPNFRRLSQCSVDEEIVFQAVTFSEEKFLNYLNEKQLALGDKLRILRIENFDHSMKIEIGNRSEILSQIACERILVN